MNSIHARLTAAAALVVCVSLHVPRAAEAKPAGAPLWATYRGNHQRTGQSPFKGPVNLRVKWQVDLEREICASPAVGPDGTVYIGTGATFYAISTEGKILWKQNFAESGQTRPPRRGGSTGDVQAFTSSSPAIGANGLIYQVGGRGPSPERSYVIALNADTAAAQRVAWAFRSDFELRSSPLALGDGCVVGFGDERRLLALDGAGSPKWQMRNAAAYGATSSPALSHDGRTIYIGGLDGRLHALSAETGEELWSAGPAQTPAMRLPAWDENSKLAQPFTTTGQVSEAPAVGQDGAIYFGSWDGRLYAVSSDGAVRWALDLNDRITSAPALSADGRILVSTFAGVLVAVSAADGNPKVEWRAEAQSRYSSPLISADGKVYVGGMDGRLRAFDLKSGALLEELSLKGWIMASPVPGGDGLLYLGASDGFLRAIETGSSRMQAVGGASAVGRGASAPKELPPRTIAATSSAAPAPAWEEALRLARAYMNTDDAAARAAILRQVEGVQDRLDDIALALRPVPPAGARKGLIAEDKFTLPHVRAKMAPLVPSENGPIPLSKNEKARPAPGEEHLNWLYVPERYDPRTPMPLVIHLHGGGGTNTQDTAGRYLKGDEEGGNLLLSGDFIAVCPGTPQMDSQKWSYPESETHMQSIIEEYSSRYAIDPNRISLIGYSMGGIGAWWHAYRESDRFALISPGAGTWVVNYWPRLHGTMLYVVHGIYDHHTHVDYNFHAERRMNAMGVPHVFAPYRGAHLRNLARPHLDGLLEMIRTVKRDPYHRRACVVHPFIWDPRESVRQRFPSDPYSFWLSVIEIGDGGVPVERSSRNQEARVFASYHRAIPAGAVNGENLGGNRFRIRVTNVKRFGLWLHPKMDVDFAKPVRIELVRMAVDGATSEEVEESRQIITASARPSLAALLKYLGDRRDYGLIYHSVIEVPVE